jgi:pimeloyl-ACP methyl ester carboxylesterase
MMDRDISRTTLESFLLSIASLRRTDLRPFLNQVKAPVMGMYGDRDIVVHPRQWKPLQEGISCSRVERFGKAGHFIMLDEPKLFMETLQDFLNSEKLPNG